MSSYDMQRQMYAAQREKLLKQENERLLAKQKGAADDDAFIRGLISNAPTYKSAIANPEFQSLKSYAYGGGEDPLFAAKRAELARETAAGRARASDQALRAMEGNDAAMAGARANAYSALAMGGGLSSGSRERIASQGATDTLFSKQKTRAEEMRNLAGLDEASLKGTADLGIAETDQRQKLKLSIADQIAADRRAEQEFGLNAYNTKSTALAGLQKSKREQQMAEINAKKDEGSWLCSAVGLESTPYTKDEREALETFRNYASSHHPAEFEFYMSRFPEVIAAMRGKASFPEFRPMIDRTIGLVQAEQFEEAFQGYSQRCLDLIETYAPDMKFVVDEEEEQTQEETHPMIGAVLLLIAYLVPMFFQSDVQMAFLPLLLGLGGAAIGAIGGDAKAEAAKRRARENAELGALDTAYGSFVQGKSVKQQELDPGPGVLGGALSGGLGGFSTGQSFAGLADKKSVYDILSNGTDEEALGALGKMKKLPTRAEFNAYSLMNPQVAG